MKSRLLFTISSLGLLALLAIMPVRVVAQEEHQQEAQHLQGYTVLDTFTGGGRGVPPGNVNSRPGGQPLRHDFQRRRPQRMLRLRLRSGVQGG